MHSKFVVTGNYSDSPVAMDIGQYLELPYDIADMVSLKTFANGEFCPRFIPDFANRRPIGKGLAGRIVIICSSSHSLRTRNDLAMRNLILARAAKENDAERVILVEPDLFYSAQDRGAHRYGELERDRTEKDLDKFDGQPFTSLLYAQLLRQAGVDTVVTVHIHSRKVQNLFFDLFEGQFHNLIPSDVYAHYILDSDFVNTGAEGDNLVICAPDKGATPFALAIREELGLSQCRVLVMDKDRSGEREVSMVVSQGSEVGIEDIKGKDVIMVDDMVRTGTTIVKCSQRLREGGPRRLCFCVTHFHPSTESRENLCSRHIDEILTTSTIPSVLNRDEQGRLRHKLAVLKLGKWVSRYMLRLTGVDDGRFDEDFYTVDMSSKNPRWQAMSLHHRT